MSDRYTIISADAHAGLPVRGVPALPRRGVPRRSSTTTWPSATPTATQLLQMNYDYIMGWETDNEEGLRGAWDIEQRDKELDADGVTAEVMFADADAITGMASPPFGAGLSAGAIADPELAFAGARAHNRFLAEMCARSPERHGGIALVPITHDVERAVAEIEWLAEQPGIRGVMVPTMWHDLPPYNHPDYDPVWAACQAAGFPVHTHSGEAPQDEYNDNIGIYLAEVVWWAARPDVAPALLRRLRALPAAEVRGDRGGRLLGGRHDVEVGPVHGRRPHHQEDGRAAGGQDLQAAVGLLRRATSSSARRPCRKEEIRRRHVLGCDVVMWGTDYPHPEGTWPHTAERLRGDFGGIPVEDARKLLGETAARATASTWTPWRPSPSASARRRPTWARTRRCAPIPRRCAAPAGGRTSTRSSPPG